MSRHIRDVADTLYLSAFRNQHAEVAALELSLRFKRKEKEQSTTLLALSKVVLSNPRRNCGESAHGEPYRAEAALLLALVRQICLTNPVVSKEACAAAFLA